MSDQRRIQTRFVKNQFYTGAGLLAYVAWVLPWIFVKNDRRRAVNWSDYRSSWVITVFMRYFASEKNEVRSFITQTPENNAKYIGKQILSIRNITSGHSLKTTTGNQIFLNYTQPYSHLWIICIHLTIFYRAQRPTAERIQSD